MSVDAVTVLSAFQLELDGIVRTLQPELLIEIGYQPGQDHRLLLKVFQAMARRLDTVVKLCVWSPAAEEGGGPIDPRRLHWLHRRQGSGGDIDVSHVRQVPSIRGRSWL